MPGTTKHNLPYPLDTDVADVPTDIRELAIKTEEALNTKYDHSEQDQRYQLKIQVRTSLPPTGTDGDVVFLVT